MKAVEHAAGGPDRERGRGRAGQILLPALLVLPAVFLFVVLIVETGRLSSQKIRHQFALDAAAFLEMTQYTDILNRTAYVDGPFPYRIAQETGLLSTGLFPYTSQASPYEDQPVWYIQFHNSYLDPLNGPNPPSDIPLVHMHPPSSLVAVPIGAAVQIVNSYQAAYQMLGEVAADQWQVFQTATLQQHALARKSLWLNVTGDGSVAGCDAAPSNCGDEAAGGFGNIHIRYHYLDAFLACGVIVSAGGKSYVGHLTTPFTFGGSSLFQLATIPPPDVQMLEQPGFLIQQHWSPPPNFYGIDMAAAAHPYVRSNVVSAGGHLWPNPTPKFYTELLP